MSSTTHYSLESHSRSVADNIVNCDRVWGIVHGSQLKKRKKKSRSGEEGGEW